MESRRFCRFLIVLTGGFHETRIKFVEKFTENSCALFKSVVNYKAKGAEARLTAFRPSERTGSGVEMRKGCLFWNTPSEK